MNTVKKIYRVAIGGIFTESNHLVGRATTLADFERTELLRGPQILEVGEGVVGGALSVLVERGVTVLPTLFASAYPGGALTRECFLELKDGLTTRLQEALPFDAMLLPLHGAAAIDEVGDLEGDLLETIRTMLGPDIPIVVTLDCHAHVTEKMVANTDAMLAWETYPHRDTFDTGVRGARMMLDILEGKLKPTMAMAKVPAIVSGSNGNTDPPGPFADLMQFAKSKEGQGSVVSTSVFLVQPHLDLPDMGSGGLVVTHDNLDEAIGLATEIAERYWGRRFDLEPRIWKPALAVATGLEIEGGPILLLEVSDCVGGGATGDGVAALDALLKADLSETALAMVVDPDAQRICREAGLGGTVQLELGHKLDPRWARPISVTGRVEGLTDGRFLYSGGIWSGRWGEMGPCAKLKVGSVEVLISTYATYDWADEQYTSMGMDTRNAKFIVVKNPMNYRVAYAGRYSEAFVLDTPGPTTASLASVDFQSLQRPYFPKDRDIPGLRPRIYQHRSGN